MRDIIDTVINKGGRVIRKWTGNLKISDVLDIRPLYRVKGYGDIHIPITKIQRGGNVRMRNWHTGKVINTHYSNLTSLGRTIFHKEDGTYIHLLDGFDNLLAKYGEREVSEGEVELGDVCPDYHPLEFKEYHLKRVVSWYNQVIRKANEAKDQSKK